MRVWRAPRASVAPGESSREKEPKPAAAALGGDGGGSEPGPRDEAPACPQLPGTAGKLIGHHHRSSGITTPGRHAALGGPAPALPARPRRAPGKELRGWLRGSPSGLRAAERTLYSRSTSGAARGGRRAGLGGEATTGPRRCPYLSPPSRSEAERGGRGRRRKRKRRGVGWENWI